MKPCGFHWKVREKRKWNTVERKAVAFLFVYTIPPLHVRFISACAIVLLARALTAWPGIAPRVCTSPFIRMYTSHFDLVCSAFYAIPIILLSNLVLLVVHTTYFVFKSRDKTFDIILNTRGQVCISTGCKKQQQKALLTHKSPDWMLLLPFPHTYTNYY